MVEEGTQTFLLTGDARGDQITDGLKAIGKLADGGTLTVDVLKVQHHGSENNVDSDFCDAVVAKHYVFCGNGEHENPNHDVVDLMVKRRLMKPGSSVLVQRFPYHDEEAAVTHMQLLDQGQKLAQNSQGRAAFKFMETGSSFAC
jgi:hypothetical protein